MDSIRAPRPFFRPLVYMPEISSGPANQAIRFVDIENDGCLESFSIYSLEGIERLASYVEMSEANPTISFNKEDIREIITATHLDPNSNSGAQTIMILAKAGLLNDFVVEDLIGKAVVDPKSFLQVNQDVTSGLVYPDLDLDQTNGAEVIKCLLALDPDNPELIACIDDRFSVLTGYWDKTYRHLSEPVQTADEQSTPSTRPISNRPSVDTCQNTREAPPLEDFRSLPVVSRGPIRFD